MIVCCYECLGITSVSEKLETLHNLLDQLSELDHVVFERIIFHLARSVCNAQNYLLLSVVVTGLLSKKKLT